MQFKTSIRINLIRWRLQAQLRRLWTDSQRRASTESLCQGFWSRTHQGFRFPAGLLPNRALGPPAGVPNSAYFVAWLRFPLTELLPGFLGGRLVPLLVVLRCNDFKNRSDSLKKVNEIGLTSLRHRCLQFRAGECPAIEGRPCNLGFASACCHWLQSLLTLNPIEPAHTPGTRSRAFPRRSIRLGCE